MQQPLQIRFYSELIKDSQQGRNNAASGVAELLQKTEHNSKAKLQQKVCHLGLPGMAGGRGNLVHIAEKGPISIRVGI